MSIVLSSSVRQNLLSLQSTALQASQQVFAKVQGTSLFDYLQG